MSSLEPLPNRPDLLSLFTDPSSATATYDEGALEREKLRLIGVPHVITRVVYHSDLKFPKGYITVHAYIAPTEILQEAIRRDWIPGVETLTELLFQPEESIKYNDGSTGIRRQLTNVLHNQGVIDVGPVTDLSDFDRPWDEWQSFSETSEENDKNGDGKIVIPDIRHGKNGVPLAIVARHGLRASHMEEYGSDVFYLS